MENKEFFSLFPEFRYEMFEEKIEKPLEHNLHANSVVSMNALNTVIANTIEKSKLGEAGFVKHDIFSSPALEEKVCSDDILSPLYNVPSYDDMFDEYALRNSCSLDCDDTKPLVMMMSIIFSVHLLLRRKLVMITICLLFLMIMVMGIIIMLNLLLL
jgi:hypothetical protein